MIVTENVSPGATSWPGSPLISMVTSPVTMNSVHVALAAGAGSAGSGNINTATDEALTFHGAPSIIIPAGKWFFPILSTTIFRC